MRSAARTKILIGLAVVLAATSGNAGRILHLNDEAPRLQVVGQNENDQLGWPYGRDLLAAGDLNGDGVQDLAVGHVDSDGAAEDRLRSGACHVFFGPFDQGRRWDLATEPSDFTVHGAAIEDLLGASILVADLDGDGRDDLACAATGQDVLGSRERTGAVNVFFGPLAAGVVDLAAADADWRVEGAEGTGIGDYLGAMDVNADGQVDLAVGAELGTRLDSDRPGELSILFGPHASTPVRNLDSEPADLRVLGVDHYDRAGMQAAFGELTGDGVSDLVLSLFAGDGPDNTRSSAGEVVLLPGPFVAGLIDLGSVVPHAIWYGADAGDFLGRELVVGDISGDGVSDLVISAQRADGPENQELNMGEVHVWFGPIAPGPRDLAEVAPDVMLHGERQFGFAGQSVAFSAATLDRDAILAVSAPGSESSDGGTYIFHQLDGSIPVINLGDDCSAMTIVGTEWSYAGCSGLLHDFDSDGRLEIVLGGAHHEEAGLRTNCGTVLVTTVDLPCPDAPLPASNLRVTQAVDAIAVDFEPAPASPFSRVYRGTLAGLWGEPPWDHGALADACRLTEGHYSDAEAATWGTGDLYYLAVAGCDGAPGPLISELGTGDAGRRPTPAELGTSVCLCGGSP